MTLIGSAPEPPVAPGTTPQPAVSDTHATRAAAETAAALTGRVHMGRRVLRKRRLPVMYAHASATPLTGV
ncbi:hypothetical protein SALBM311S_01024 [Streptomyces alboniger]